MQIYDSYLGVPVIAKSAPFPTPGSYYSIITGAYGVGITPSFKKDDSCFVVSYKLLSEKDFAESTFEETYYPDSDCPRSKEFFSYLSKLFPDVGEADAYIGTREKLEICWDIVGGVAYPVVKSREFIGYGETYTKNYLNVEEDEEEEED